MMVVNNEYNIGDTVYIKTDKDQDPGMITAILLRNGDYIVYEVTRDETVRWYCDFELTYDKVFVK